MPSQNEIDPLRLTLAVGARQLAKAHTRERVRNAARELFLTRGFAETTAQLVAEQARVAVGTLFQHASDKEDLLLLIVHEPMAAAIRASGQLESADLLTDLTVMFGSLLEVYADLDRAAAASVRAQWFGTGPNARAVQWLHERFLQQIVVRVERAQQEGALTTGADARAVVANLSGIYQGVLLDWLWGDDDLEAAVGRLRGAFALQVIPLQTTTPGTPG